MNKGPRWLRIMEKHRGQKSPDTVPLSANVTFVMYSCTSMSRVGGGVSTQREDRAQDTADLSSTLQNYVIYM